MRAPPAWPEPETENVLFLTSLASFVTQALAQLDGFEAAGPSTATPAQFGSLWALVACACSAAIVWIQMLPPRALDLPPLLSGLYSPAWRA